MKKHAGLIITIVIVLIIVGYIVYYELTHKTGTPGSSSNTTTAPGGTGGSQGLTITKAEYFWPGSATTEAGSKDVTGILQGLITGNVLDFNSSKSVGYYNRIFGDPSPGNGPKTLRVDYSIGGKTGEISAQEDSELKINT